MKKQHKGFRIGALLLIFIMLFSLWSPSIFATEDESQPGEEPEIVKDAEEVIDEEGAEEEEPPVQVEEPVDGKKQESPSKEENKENDKVDEKGELAEDVPPVMMAPISIPMMKPSIGLMAAGDLEDTIEVNKTAKRLKGLCRTYEVTLEITGTPQEAPVDVVLVIDKSGSMNESTGSGYGYYRIASTPANNSTYYVKVNGQYKSVSRINIGSWANSNYKWAYNDGGYRYVEWDFNGDDTSAGSTDSSNPLSKPFYTRGNTRLHHAKGAAINFAAKVLGTDGIPGSRVSLVTFSGPQYAEGSWSNPTRHYGNQNQAQTVRGLTDDLAILANDINGISAGGGTNTEAGFLQGRKVIEESNNLNSNKVVIMFTDGLPTASNGNPYAESTDINHIHNQKALAAGKGIHQNEVADVFTIGLLQGMTTTERNLALQILEETQNKGWYEAPTAQDLDQIFDDIANHLGYAATNAMVVDKIGDNFDLVVDSLPPGATYNSTTREITWNPGTIYEEATLTYKVKPKENIVGEHDTNKYAELTYTDIFGNDNKTKDFPVPRVNVPTLLQVSLSDATIILGDSISLGSGTDSSGENYMNIFGGDGIEGEYAYEWKKVGETGILSTERNPEVSPDEDTTYELTVTDSNGCKAVATMKVTVRKLKVTIKKIVEGNYADLDRDFDFTVWINDDQAGQNFQLSHEGEPKVIENIGKDSTIKLKENLEDSEGYQVTVKVGDQSYLPDASGVYEIQVGNEDITITVTNSKNTTPDVGISLDSLPYILTLTIGLGGLGVMLVRKRRIRD